MLRYPFTPTPPQNTCRSLVRKYNCISSSWYLGTYTLEITKFYLYVTNWCTAVMKNKRTLFSVVNKYSHKGRTSASYQGSAFKKNNAKISGKFYHYIKGLTFVVLFSFQKWVQFVEHLKFIPVTACYLFRVVSILSNQRPLILSNIYHFWNTRQKTCSISREVVKDHERFAVSHATGLILITTFGELIRWNHIVKHIYCQSSEELKILCLPCYIQYLIFLQ